MLIIKRKTDVANYEGHEKRKISVEKATLLQ